MKVLMLGATGLVGGETMRLIVEDEQISRIVVLTRKDIHPNNSKIEQHIIDFDKMSSADYAFNNVDAVVCALGTTIEKAKTKEAFRKVDFEYVVTAANIAKKKHVKKFVLVSSIGANPKSQNFYLKTKGETEEAVRQIGFNNLVILRPSLLLGERNEKRVGEKQAQKIMPKISFLIPKKYVPVHAKDVAKKIVEQLKNTDPKNEVITSDKIN